MEKIHLPKEMTKCGFKIETPGQQSTRTYFLSSFLILTNNLRKRDFNLHCKFGKGNQINENQWTLKFTSKFKISQFIE